MKQLLIFLLTLTTTHAMACRLSTPIELDSLLLEKQRELFAQVESHPKLDELIERGDLATAYPIMLNLSYTMMGESDHNAQTIGARLSFNDSVGRSFGLSDVYLNSPLERSITHTNGTIVHTVSSTSFGVPEMKSTVVIKNRKIVSIEIMNQALKKKTCVTKALR